MPGSTPPTSQLDWLISTTAMIVLSWSRATRDLLKSFGWGIRALHQLDVATMVLSPRRPAPYHLAGGIAALARVEATIYISCRRRPCPPGDRRGPIAKYGYVNTRAEMGEYPIIHNLPILLK